MTLQAHASAILTRLALAGTTYDGRVPDGSALPYRVVHFAFSTPTGETDPDKVALTMDSQGLNVDAYVHSVGGSAQAARAVATGTRTQLLNWRPTISGRICFPMRHTENVPADPNETTGTLVVDIVDVYRLVSVPS